MQNKSAKTAAEYMAALPLDRRKTISAVRAMVKKNLPKGYVETMDFGMISYVVPLKRFPETYNGHPLMYAALASQKNFCSLYLMGAHGKSKDGLTLREAFKAAGKKLDMGKSCIHFQTPDDLPMQAIGEIIGSIPPDKWIDIFEASRKR